MIAADQHPEAVVIHPIIQHPDLSLAQFVLVRAVEAEVYAGVILVEPEEPDLVNVTQQFIGDPDGRRGLTHFGVLISVDYS